MKKLLILVSLFFSRSIFAMSQLGRPAIVVSMAGTSVDANLLANSETELSNLNLFPEVKLDLDVCPDGRVLVNLCHSGPLKIKCSDKEIEVQANALMLARLLAAKRRVVSSSYGAMFTAHDKLDLSQYLSNFITDFNDFLENKIKINKLSVGQIIKFLNLFDYLQLKEESKIKELCKELINKNVHFEDIKKTELPDAALKCYLQTYIKEKEKPSEFLKNGIITYKQTGFVAHDDWVNAVAITADGKMAITGSNKNARIIDVETGQVLHTITHGYLVAAIAIKADGCMAIIGSWDRKARIIDVKTGTVSRTIAHHDDDWVRAIAITADGGIAITGSWAKIINLKTGKIREIAHDDEWVRAVAITADGSTAITGSREKKARIIDVKTGKILHEIAHGDWVEAVAISADGSMAITGSLDNKARIIDVKTGKVLYPIAHDARVCAVAITADGSIAITGSGDNKARIIDVATGKVLHEITYDNQVTAVAISADCKTVIIGSMGNARIMKLDLSPIENVDLDKLSLDKLIEWYNSINADPASAPGTSSQASQIKERCNLI